MSKRESLDSHEDELLEDSATLYFSQIVSIKANIAILFIFQTSVNQGKSG